MLVIKMRLLSHSSAKTATSTHFSLSEDMTHFSIEILL